MRSSLYALLFLLLLAACSTDESGSQPEVVRQATVTFMTTPNGLGDNGYNDAAAEGIFAFADEMLLKRCAYHGLNFAAPFIVMRHWDCMKEDGTYFCGEFDTDDTDWQLAELLVNIQYACQRHFFGKMAEEYFEQQQQEACVGIRRKDKTIEAYQRLPEEFTVEDVMRCFGAPTVNAARTRICRLTADRLVEKTGTQNENGAAKARYRKTGRMML